MSELLSNLALGFGVAFSPMNVLFCLLGALVGTLVGVLPGIGTVATIAMLLPITFGLPPVGALIMLAGIYYGAQYGGSTTSVLVNIPGEATSVITCLDGHQMARQARALHRRDRLVLCGLRGDGAGGGPRPAADQPRAAVRAGRIFLADGAGPDLRGGAGQGLGAQSGRHGAHRFAALDGRFGPGD